MSSNRTLANYRLGNVASYLKGIPTKKLGNFTHCDIRFPRYNYSNFDKLKEDIIVCLYLCR